MPQHIHFHSSPGYICGILLKQQPYIWKNQQIYISDSWAASTIPNHFSHSFKAAQIKHEWFWRDFECLYQGSWVPPPMRSPLSLQYAQNIPKTCLEAREEWIAGSLKPHTHHWWTKPSSPGQIDSRTVNSVRPLTNVWTGKQVLGGTPRSLLVVDFFLYGFGQGSQGSLKLCERQKYWLVLKNRLRPPGPKIFTLWVCVEHIVSG